MLKGQCEIAQILGLRLVIALLLRLRATDRLGRTLILRLRRWSTKSLASTASTRALLLRSLSTDITRSR